MLHFKHVECIVKATANVRRVSWANVNNFCASIKTKATNIGLTSSPVFVEL